MVHVNVGRVGVKTRGIDKKTQRPFTRKKYYIRFDLQLVFKVYSWHYLNILKYSFLKYILLNI